uniref:NADH dehydrogenase subunit 6 n=1 Tax=Metacrangonyx dhofarensis TaxID=2291046 RepID=A0A345UDK7_9CRUS|nr:NADH dehydrogenase subunit 6 [Metacrangonyx dhofarensis]
MIYFVFSFLSLYLVFIFLYLSHPLFLSLVIGCQAIVVSLFIYMYSGISWFSYVMFMAFLSGMMIVLLYVSSLSPNNVVSYYIWNSKFFFFPLFIVFFCFWFFKVDSFSLNSFLSHTNLSATVYLSSKIYSLHMYVFTVLMICYLLLLLVLVVKNSMFAEGPLRAS